MSLDGALTDAIANIPDCLAVGYIDLETGMLLGAQSAESNAEASLETLAVAVGNLFEGQGISVFQDMLREVEGGREDTSGFGEILVVASGRLHVFIRRQDYPHHVICFLFEENANVGLALTRTHMNLSNITSQV